MQNKYQAKAVFYDTLNQCQLTREEVEFSLKNYPKCHKANIVRFDSTLEFKTYLALRRWYSRSQIICQYQIEIIPPSTCFPKGKKHKIDFAITVSPRSEKIAALVEAKGYQTKIYPYILSLIERHQPKYFDKYYLVFANSVEKKSAMVDNFHRKTGRVMTLDQLTNRGLKIELR